jgi:hypothetical protein
MELILIKPKRTSKCRICKSEYIKRSMAHKVCGTDCAVALNDSDKRRKEAKIDKVCKEALKSLSDLKREAQTVFNAFIRERDKLSGYTCISSGRPLDWSGNQVDAGHYRSIGSASHLRFNEHNVHAQSKLDNLYLSGNAVDYRIGLIKRIGLPFVEALESDQAIKKWTREELVELKIIYREKLKKLKIV